MRFLRSCTVFSTLLLAAAVGSASAQTVLELTYTPAGGSGQQTCVFTTDGNNVSLNAANNRLQAAGTFGANCPTSTPVTNPAILDGLEGDVGASVTTGSSVTLTWRADADSCVYNGSSFPNTVTFTNWPTTGSACATSGTCSAPHSTTLQIPAGATGNYKFKLTCSKTGNPTTVSTEVTTNATAIPTGCSAAPAGLTRLTSVQICETWGSPCRTVDGTKFENVLGYDIDAPTVPIMWPGKRNVTQRPYIGSNSFLALQFTVPSTYPTNRSGGLKISETNFTGPLTMTMSTSCGDFGATSQISPKCIVSGGQAGQSLTWSTYPAGTTTGDNSCRLTPGQTYYFNLLYAPISNPTQTSCTAGECSNPIYNGGAF